LRGLDGRRRCLDRRRLRGWRRGRLPTVGRHNLDETTALGTLEDCPNGRFVADGEPGAARRACCMEEKLIHCSAACSGEGRPLALRPHGPAQPSILRCPGRHVSQLAGNPRNLAEKAGPRPPEPFPRRRLGAKMAILWPLARDRNPR
jgi:hypothetical protein